MRNRTPITVLAALGGVLLLCSAGAAQFDAATPIWVASEKGDLWQAAPGSAVSSNAAASTAAIRRTLFFISVPSFVIFPYCTPKNRTLQ